MRELPGRGRSLRTDWSPRLPRLWRPRPTAGARRRVRAARRTGRTRHALTGGPGAALPARARADPSGRAGRRTARRSRLPGAFPRERCAWGLPGRAQVRSRPGAAHPGATQLTTCRRTVSALGSARGVGAGMYSWLVEICGSALSSDLGTARRMSVFHASFGAGTFSLSST